MVKADKFLYPIERYLHELEDEEGNVFVWISRGELECGQSYIVTGTVKEHKTRASNKLSSSDTNTRWWKKLKKNNANQKAQSPALFDYLLLCPNFCLTFSTLLTAIA